MKIGDLFYAVSADTKGVDAALTKVESRAGTIGQRISASMGNAFKVGLAGVGAAGGALFAVAARGGAELTDATLAFQAATGATAAEAEVAQASIAKLYANNLAGFAELGSVLAAVETNLGLSGDAAETAAQKVLDYAKVTGQDAVGAVTILDDLTDGYNLKADEQVKVLDLLLAGTQKYGGSVVDNQQALAALAPALNAANLTYRDGAGLLNLFAAAGIDAAVAPVALTKALSKVESPEELQTLIADIARIEDPFARASAASDLFGAKAGAKLAQALGKGDLTTFALGMEDVAGAVDTASAAIDSSPLNKFKLVLKGLAGPLAEAGTSFGPLVLGFASLGGGKVVGAATTALGGFAGKALPMLTAGLAGLLPALAGTLATVGSAMGGALAAAIPIGMALLPVILIAALVAAIVFLVNNPEIVAKIGEVIGSVLSAIAGFLGVLPGIFASAFGAAVGAVAGAVGQMVGFILKLPFRILGLQVKMLELFASIATNILGGVAQLIANVVGFFVKLPGRIASFGPAIIAQVATMATSIAGKVGQTVASIVTFFLSIPGRIAALGGRIVSGIIGGMASLPGKLVDTIASAFRNIKIDIGPFHISASGVRIDLPNIQLPSFAVGTPFVPADMLAMVHRREMIIPAREAEAIRQGRASLGRPDRAQTAATGNATTNITNVTVEGLMRARDPFELDWQLRRLQDRRRLMNEPDVA